jgi:hypothetical protein
MSSNLNEALSNIPFKEWKSDLEKRHSQQQKWIEVSFLHAFIDDSF